MMNFGLFMTLKKKNNNCIVSKDTEYSTQVFYDNFMMRFIVILELISPNPNSHTHLERHEG